VTQWRRFVAVGDSITEGLCDPIIGRGEPWLGWADRLSVILAGSAQLHEQPFSYANLAVRGRGVRDVVHDQIPRAIEMKADLVSVLVGANDLAGVGNDPDRVAAELETGIAALRASGADVLLGTIFDPRFAFFLKPLRGRAAVYNANLWSIARDHETFTLDLWGMRELQTPGMWAQDRVHLTPSGHRLLALKASHSLGVAYTEVSAEALEGLDRLPTVGWLREHVLPWAGRRIRRSNSGDGIEAKIPELIKVITRR